MIVPLLAGSFDIAKNLPQTNINLTPPHGNFG